MREKILFPEGNQDHIFKKIKNIGKLSATFLSLFLALSIAKPVFAEKSDDVDKQGYSEKDAMKYLKNIFIVAGSKGIEGKINQIPVKKLESPDKKIIITIGYSSDKKVPEWVINESEDGSILFFDEGADGVVDRVVTNKKEGESNKQRSAFNIMKAFSSSKSLSEEAEISASLMPEEVRVYDFEKNSLTVKSFDFQSGKAEELDNKEQAKKIIEKVQGVYIERLKNVNDIL